MSINSLAKWKPIIPAAALVLFITGCSSNGEVPDDLLTRAESNVSQAESIKADDYAPVALREAKLNVERARTAIAAEDYPKAEMLLEKAIADAEYASVKAHSEQSQKAAKQIKSDINTLQQHIDGQ